MSMPRALILSLALLLTPVLVYGAGAVILAPGESVEVRSTDCDLSSTQHSQHRVSVVCGPAATPAAQSDTHEGVAVCSGHNPTKWHALVERDAAGAILCTHLHEHHANPNGVNDIFGPTSAWYGGTQEISYPWQTSSTAGLENVMKHQGYKWYVERGLPCPANGTCVLAFRIQVHSLGTVSDEVVRFHSFGLEALVSHQGVQGIVRHGGHVDYGFLGLLVDGGDAVVCPGIDADPPTFACRDSGVLREASSANVPAPHTAHNAQQVNWYGRHGVTSISLRIEEFGPMDYAEPARQLFYPPPPDFASIRTGNNSLGRIGNLLIALNTSWVRRLTGPDGRLNLRTYTDRHGSEASGCAAPSPDCAPLVVEGALAASYRRDDFNGPMVEHDRLSPATGKSLISWPN